MKVTGNMSGLCQPLEFIPLLCSGAWADIGSRSSMEDVYVCADNMMNDFGQNDGDERSGAFYGDNNIVYWKKFVSEYYAPDSYKRWCFSTYSDDKRHAAGVFYPKPMEPWCCDIFSSRSGKGLEFEALLPRLFKTKFDSGLLDEIMFLDLPRAYSKISSGLLVLEYRKATQESIYENFRGVHEVKLQIIFRWDLKILSWEFCVQNQEEYLLRSLVAPGILVRSRNNMSIIMLRKC